MTWHGYTKRYINTHSILKRITGLRNVKWIDAGILKSTRYVNTHSDLREKLVYGGSNCLARA